MMQDTMGPPNKRRRLLSSAQDFLQQSEAATRTPAPQFSHGIEHLQGPQATRTLKAKASPQHIEEVHLEIRNEPAADVGNGIRWFRRQGTAASTDALSTSSESGADVAVTAGVGILDASATAAVSADLPDASLVSGSDSSSTSSDASVGPLSTGASSSTESDSSEPVTSNTPTPTTSSGAVSSQAATGSSGVPLSTGATSSSEESSQYGTGSSKVPLSTGDASSSQQASQYGTGSSRGPSSMGTAASSSSSSSESSQGGTGSSRIPLSTGTAAQSSTASPSSATISGSSASSNGSVPVSSSTGSQGSSSIVAGTVSGYTASTLPASSSHRMNLTTSASVRTSGSVVFTSDYTIDLASATSSSGSRTTDSSSSFDLAALFLATLSGGEVETFTRSDESFTTTLSDGQTATISPSSSRGSSTSSTQGSSSRQSGSVTTISNDRSTVRSTVFSTATPSSTQSSSGDSTNGVGIAGAAGEGATATSNGAASATPTPDDSGNSDDGPAPAGTIAGGVVGGAAGLALVLVMVLFFLRRYKKRSQIGHRALPPNSGGMASEADPAVSSGGPGMAERAGLMPFAGAVPAFFRHSNRSDNAGADTGERGFQRVSGRKLPSAFSEGMTGPPRNVMSPPPTMPLVGHEGSLDENANSHAPYRDSVGFYGTTGSPTSPNPFSDNNAPSTGRVDGNSENLTMSPGPQRTPTVHAARPDVQNPSVATSGVPSWTPSSAAAFARSDTPASLDGSRNSRFTEEV